MLNHTATEINAVDIIAREIIARVLAAIETDFGEWGDWPDVGEYDWEAIQDVIRNHIELFRRPTVPDVDAAYELLKNRADHDALI